MSEQEQTIRSYPFPNGKDPLEISPTYAHLREHEPVSRIRMPTGEVGWLVTRAEEAKLVLADQRFGRAEALRRPKVANLLPVPIPPEALLALDPPEHTRVRKSVARYFTSRQVETLRPFVRETADRLLGQIAEGQGGPVDLLATYARPLPMTVLCRLLGIPEADLATFDSWSEGLADSDVEEVGDAFGMLTDYMTGLVRRKKADPAGDLLSDLATDDGPDALDERETVMMGAVLLVGAFDTTAALLARSVLMLLRERERYELLRDRPELIQDAVEEMLRTNAFVHLLAPRMATTDVWLGDVLVREGEGVMVSVAAANEDSALVDDPDRIDLERTDPPHLTFGHGIHHCLGASLARLETQVALERLVAWFPELRLAVPPEQVPVQTTVSTAVLSELPVRW